MHWGSFEVFETKTVIYINSLDQLISIYATFHYILNNPWLPN